VAYAAWTRGDHPNLVKIADFRTVGHMSNIVFDPNKLLKADERSRWIGGVLVLRTRS